MRACYRTMGASHRCSDRLTELCRIRELQWALCRAMAKQVEGICIFCSVVACDTYITHFTSPPTSSLQTPSSELTYRCDLRQQVLRRLCRAQGANGVQGRDPPPPSEDNDKGGWATRGHWLKISADAPTQDSHRSLECTRTCTVGGAALRSLRRCSISAEIHATVFRRSRHITLFLVAHAGSRAGALVCSSAHVTSRCSSWRT
jgi:hypothetical protein